MIGATISAFLLLAPASQEANPLEPILAALEKRVEGVRDFRASFVTTTFDTDPRTKARRSRSPFHGDLVWRAPGRAAWSARITDRYNDHQAYASWAGGWRGAIDEAEVRLHIPYGLHVTKDFGGLYPREHHGAIWYRAGLDTHTPAPLPLLSDPPTFHPILFLFELAPRAILGRMPTLRVLHRHQEEGRKFMVLVSKPVDARDAARVDESERRRDETWFGTEIWIDEAEGAIDRVIVSVENSGASPRHRYTHVFKYSRRVGGMVTLIASEGSQMEFRDLRSNSGVKEEEARIDFPADAVVRDWVAQPKDVYEKRLAADPADASAWLSLGTLRFRAQSYASAVEAFKKVVALRPKAAEGYVALSYFLDERSTADDVRDFLDEAVKKGANAPVMRLSMAHHRQRDSLPHFEAVLQQVGEDPDILETMIYKAGFPGGREAQRHYFRLFKAEIAKDEPTFGYTRWQYQTPAERQELAKMYEDAIAATGGSLWMRKRLMDQYAALKRTPDLRRHAEAVVAQVEREDNPKTQGADERAMEFFTAEKDWAGAARLQKAFAAKTGALYKRAAALFEVELLAARGTMDELKKLIDERVKTEWNPREKLSYSPTYVHLIKILAREKRSTEFLKKIVESIGDDENRPLYIDVVEDAVKNFHVPHVDGQALRVRLKEKTTGASAGATDLVALCRQYAWAKQWTAAADKANEALAHKDVTIPQRATAEGVLAECHLAKNAFEQAIAACDRALGLKDLRPYPRSGLSDLRGRALLGAKREREAIDAFARAFVELLGERHPETRWRAIKELRRSLPDLRRASVEEAASAKADDGGLKLLLLRSLEGEGQYARAASTMAEVVKLWPGDGFFLRELTILWARAEEPQKALAARSAFGAAREKQRDALMGVQADDFGTIDFHLVSALEAREEVGLLKEFAVKLTGEADPGRHTSTLARILAIVSEDEFIEKVHAALMAAATREDQRIHHRYAAAQAWHEMGKTEKAVALYKDAAAGKGVTPTWARIAREMIQRLEAEGKERTELLAWIRERMAKVPPGRRETIELHVIIREVSTSRKVPLLDRLWRNGLRAKTPEALFLKLAALRSKGFVRARVLEQLGARVDVSPEWRLEFATVFLEKGDFAKAMEVMLGAIEKIALPAKDREGFIRQVLSVAWGLSEKNRADLGRDLAGKNLFAWAWELREQFLPGADERLELARRWKKAAEAGEDRALAMRAIARTLLYSDEASALAELSEALKEKDLGGDLRSDLERMRLKPLMSHGTPEEAGPALILHLQESPLETALWANVVVRAGRGDAWLKLWEAAGPQSPAALFFAASIEINLDRREAALARLIEGSKQLPDIALLLRQLGDLYVLLEKFDLAAAAFEKAILHGKGGDGEVLYLRQELARATGKAGKLKEAADIIKAVSDQSRRFTFVGIAEELKLFDLAAQIYRDVLQDPKADVALRLSLARVLRAAGKPEEAQEQFRLLLASEGGQRVAALSGLLTSLAERKDAKGFAHALLEEARRTQGGRRELLQAAALAANVPVESLPGWPSEWRKAAKEGDDVEAVHVLSALLARRTNGPLFGEDLRASLKRFPESPSLQLEAAEQLLESRRFAEAAAAFQRAAALDPEGKQTGTGRPELLDRAMTSLRSGGEFEKLFMLALTMLEGADDRMGRRHLLTLDRQVDFDLWPELSRRRDRLPAPRDAASAEKIRLLIVQLGDDVVDEREAASRSLRALSLPALRPLAALVESADIEIRSRARTVIRAILKE